MTVVVKGRKRHRCWQWCGQQILGIAENVKLTSTDWDPATVIELRCRRPVLAGPGYTLVCRHNRSYYVRQLA